MRCQKCGAYIRDDSVFCNYCGEKVIVHVPKKENGGLQEAIRPRDEDFDVEPTTPKEPERVQTPRKQKAWVIAVIFAACAVFALLAVLFYQFQKKNQRTVINPQPGTSETSQSTRAPESTQSSEQETSSSDSLPAEEESTETETPASEETVTESETEETAAETGDDTAPASEESTEEPSSSIPEGVETEYGGMIYLVSEGEATLQKCYSSDEVVELPDQISGVPLTAIGEAAFANCEHLRAIDIPEGVTEFGPYAFTYCRNLKAIVVPASMTKIGDHCFDNTGGFTFIMQENSVGHYIAVNNHINYLLGDSLTVLEQAE